MTLVENTPQFTIIVEFSIQDATEKEWSYYMNLVPEMLLCF